MAERRYISVIVPLRLEWEPCYWTMDEDVVVGDAVRVPIGGKEYVGVVSATNVAPTVSPARIREVIAVVRDLPRISPEEIGLWKQIADYYMCTVGEVCKAACPPGKISMEQAAAQRKRKAAERELARLEKLRAAAQKKGRKRGKKAAEENGPAAEVIAEGEVTAVAREEVNGMTPNVSGQGAEKVGPKGSDKSISANAEAGNGRSDSGSGTDPEEEALLQAQGKVKLSPAQLEAEREILEAFALGRTALLNGVTGSGKTEIYTSLALKALRAGRNVLYLVPEIALSRQLEARMRAVFGDLLTVYHSGETPAKRQAGSASVRSGKRYIVLGTRSAVLLPHHDLGLIIVDEEQDSSYKQDAPAPRYNGRDTALMLGAMQSGGAAKSSGSKTDGMIANPGTTETAYAAAKSDAGEAAETMGMKTNLKGGPDKKPATKGRRDDATFRRGCHVVLGSATPSLESLYNCMSGKYREVRLTERYYGTDGADVEIIDTTAERRKWGMKGSFSIKLIERIRKCLSHGEQVMILRARRGYAPVLQCRECGHILRCPDCNITLTYHKGSSEITEAVSGRAVCHHCGYSVPAPERCPECGGEMAPLGAGTQKVEEEAALLFPTARIARLDSDVMQSRRAEKEVIGSFAKGETDILIGTQVIAKGFDFPNLKLVAVLQADTLLGVRDFRADERALQTLVQLAGRSGRRQDRGTLVIQTAQPAHPVYASLLAGNDADAGMRNHSRKAEIRKNNARNDGYNSKNGTNTSRSDAYNAETGKNASRARTETTDRRQTDAEKENSQNNIINTLLAERREFDYPPFTRQICLTVKHKVEAAAESLATKLVYELSDLKAEGPAVPTIERDGGQFVRTVSLTLERDKDLGHRKRALLRRISLFESKENCPGSITIDVDPV